MVKKVLVVLVALLCLVGCAKETDVNDLNEIKKDINKIQIELENLVEVRRNIDDSSSKQAGAAYELFLIEENENNKLVYIKNAISHEPNNVSYYQAYWDYLKTLDIERAQLDDFVEYLSIGYSYVDASEISILNSINDEVMLIQQSLFALGEGTEFDTALLDTWNVLYDELCKMQDPALFDVDLFINILESMDSVYGMMTLPDSNVSNIYEEIDLLYSLVSGYRNINHIFSDLSEMNDNDYIVLAELYIPMCENVIRLFGTRNVELLGDFRSLLVYCQLEILNIYNDIKLTYSSKLDSTINSIINTYSQKLASAQIDSLERKMLMQELAVQVNALAEKITDVSGISFDHKYSQLIEEQNDKLYSSYQIWASKILVYLHEELKSVKKDEMLRTLFRNRYFDIDVSLLIPELKKLHESLWKDSYIDNSNESIDILISKYPIEKRKLGDV